MEGTMFRALMEEASTLASIGIFLTTVAIWVQLFTGA
jgi:hypothetical protein